MNPYGHVAIVKANDSAAGRITISEMNYGGNFNRETGKTSNFAKETETTLSYKDIQARSVHDGKGNVTATYPLEGFILPF